MLDKDEKTSRLELPRWADIERDGARLEKIIKKMQRKVILCTSIDQLIKLCNAIAFVTGKKLEISYKITRLTEIINKAEKKNKI